VPGTDQRSRNLIVLVPLALSLGLASCVTPTATWQRQVSAGGCLSYPAYVPAGSGYYSQGSSGQSAPRRLERICRVSYAKEYGWSTEYTMGVEFLTGAQLNSATGSYSYNSYDCYALLWFGKGEVAILKHTGLAVGASPVCLRIATEQRHRFLLLQLIRLLRAPLVRQGRSGDSETHWACGRRRLDIRRR